MKRKRGNKILQKALPHLKNKYLFTPMLFIVWLAFFDKNDFIAQYSSRKQLKELLSEKQYYTDEIERNKEKLYELTSSPANLEKFAREKYLMKKDNEDIFLIVYNETKKENKYHE
jgi:cell division protein FtsB